MPYYRRYRYYPRRHRRIWRRRIRGTLRRRRYWRRRHWVRKPKRKLRKIFIQEWQPSTIKKLKVIGKYPIFEGTTERTGHNNTQYIDTITPYKYPGGGLFSIIVFTLEGLYELHKKARNWWTTSNCNLPLIRYTGCKITLYKSAEIDYVTVYARCGSLTATEQLYNSCQPSILQLNKHKRIITCKKYNKKTRPYKTLRIPPPANMTNKWYFQSEIAKIPLLMLISSATSLDRYYIPASSISSTLGFISLNTAVFEYNDFKVTRTEPYKPNDTYWLFTIAGRTATLDTATFAQLILLGNTKDWTPGTTFSQNSDVDTYFSTPARWGNPFYSPYLDPDHPILIHNNLQEVKQKAKSNYTGKLKENGFTEITKPLVIHCRYNPQADQSNNAIFISKITQGKTKWHEPTDPKLSNKGLPIWLLTFGWHDWLLKSDAVQRLDTDYCAVIISDHIQPEMTYYVPLDDYMLHGNSPYETDGHIKPYDHINWHPKFNFQMSTINHIVNTGPGTAKLPEKVSAEGHIGYKFYFKVGGCPPPMDNVCDPKNQPTFPTPSNIISPTLLQDPETPMQYYIQSFDQRRDILTDRAAKRIKKDYDITKTFLKPTGQTAMDIRIKTPETTSTEDSSEEEKEEQTYQLKRHKRKQRKLRNRILQLLELIKD